MKNLTKQLGQGMTEYIIIVALIAIAGIAAYGFFGDTLRSQTGAIATELAGQDGTAAKTQAATKAQSAVQDGATTKTLSNYEQGN